MQAEVAQLLPHVGGEEVVAVDVGGAGRELFVDEGANGFAQGIDVFTQVVVQAGQGHGESPRCDAVNFAGRCLPFGLW